MKAWCLILFGILFARLFMFPQTAGAAQNAYAGIELYPAFSEVTITAQNEEKIVDIHVVNHNTYPVSVKVFPLDFKQANNNGQIDFIGQNSAGYSYSLTSFLTFENTIYQIEPGATEMIRVTAKNRDDLSPGGHYAAVIVQDETGGETEGETRVAHALSSLILLRKTGGELFNLSLVDVPWAHSALRFSLPDAIDLLFQNEGNIHMTPYGKVEISDMFGRIVSKGIINVSSQRVFPETQRYIRTDMETQGVLLPFSINRFHVSGTDSLHKTRFVHDSLFLYIDVRALVLFAIFVGGVIFIIRLKRKR